MLFQLGLEIDPLRKGISRKGVAASVLDVEHFSHETSVLLLIMGTCVGEALSDLCLMATG
jgi:hypothetical protein